MDVSALEFRNLKGVFNLGVFYTFVCDITILYHLLSNKGVSISIVLVVLGTISTELFFKKQGSFL